MINPLLKLLGQHLKKLSVYTIYHSVNAQYLEEHGFSRLFSVKIYQHSPSKAILDAYLNETGIELFPHLFQTTPLNVWKGEEGKKFAKKGVFLIAADLGYTDPTEQFNHLDLKIAHLTNGLQVLKSMTRIRNLFPEKSKWKKIMNGYRTRMGLSATDLSQSHFRKERDTKIHPQNGQITVDDLLPHPTKEDYVLCPIRDCFAHNDGIHRNRRFEHLKDGHWFFDVIKCDFPFPQDRECGTVWPTNYHMQKHKKIHKDEKLHVCEVCSQRFSMPHELNNHQDRICKPKWVCDLCDTNPQSQFRFDEHKFVVHGVGKTGDESVDLLKKIDPRDPQRIICDLCGKSYKNDYLVQHLTGVHRLKLVYQCNNKDRKSRCKHKTETYNQMLQHKKEVHNEFVAINEIDEFYETYIEFMYEYQYFPKKSELDKFPKIKYIYSHLNIKRKRKKWNISGRHEFIRNCLERMKNDPRGLPVKVKEAYFLYRPFLENKCYHGIQGQEAVIEFLADCQE